MSMRMAHKWTKASRAKLSRSQKARWRKGTRQRRGKRYPNTPRPSATATGSAPTAVYAPGAPELTAKKIVFRSPGVGIGKDARHDATRPYQQHATVRHDVSIAPGLRHAGGDLIEHRAQLDPRRQLGPDIGVDGGGRLTLQRLVDRAALIVRERLEGVGNGDDRVVGRVLRGELRRHRIGIRRRARNRQGAVDERRVRRRAGVRWRLLL